ncbi:MAG: cyclic nucleotide-binding domain-containing protein [Treponema sp.]|nr:cyclic nucleotide-binding domain-containing protein [Treponema sp.]
MTAVNIAENFDFSSIKRQELFLNLQKNGIDFVIAHSAAINLEKNKPLFSTGEKASRFYILTHGEIRVFKKNTDGSEVEMARFAPGDTIGDFDFARSANYDANAEAAEDSRLIAFPAAPDSNEPLSIDSLAQKDPDTVCCILLNAIIMMTGRIKSTRKLILENMTWVQELHRRAYEDPGTGLWKQIMIADEITSVLKDPAALIMLKPDRFKILVDSRGHSAGDEAMIRIAIILKNFSRKIGQCWALRFKSNEVGLIINNCNASKAKEITWELSEVISEMEPVPAKDDLDEFVFSATISWAIWPDDEVEWENLFSGNYSLLLDTWKEGGNKIIHYVRAA